jgi:4-hydroxy-L-threonine phosphate dehydrogenase PdxA
MKIRVGITQGDINGIGLEVIIKTFLDPAIENSFLSPESIGHRRLQF